MEIIHEENSYFKAFDAIATELEDLAKVLSPGDRGGGAADEGSTPCCNSYFSSFRRIASALGRVRSAAAERISGSSDGEIPVERIPKAASSFDFAAPSLEQGSIALSNHAVNAVTLNGEAVSFAFPAKTPGKARDFIVRLKMESASLWSLPEGVSFESDDADVFAELEEGATAVFFFFEVEEDVFMVSRKAVKAATKE